MHFGHLRRALLGVVALVVLAVAGCTSSGSPADPSSPLPTFSAPSVSIESSPSTPVSASPTFATSGPNVRPGEKPPQMLPGTEQNNAVAATQFAMFWIQTLDWGYATTDSRLAKMYFAPTCSDCKLFMQIFDHARAKHEHFRGGRLEVGSRVLAPNDHRFGANQAVDVSLSQAPLEIIDAAGHVVERDPAASVTYRLWLKWTADGWTVVQKGTKK